MSKPSPPPKYARHSSGQARVRLNGKTIYLGKFDSPESKQRYAELLGEWAKATPQAAPAVVTVDQVALLYLAHAERYYRKHGEPTSEVRCIQVALRFLVQTSGTLLAADFDAAQMEAVRDAMIAAGLVRVSINRNIGRLKRMFNWAHSKKKLVPATVLASLASLESLQRGRTEAVESDPVLPVPQAAIDAVRPLVTRPVRAMIDLQLLTGMRPGEVLSMRTGDVDMREDVWEYRPQRHKTEHRGKSRVIFIGPQAQEVIRPFLTEEADAYLFRPREGRAEFIKGAYRDDAATEIIGRRTPGSRYSLYTYHGAIRRACLKARVDHWHPHQLRHNAATALRREFGVEHTRTVLGHSTVDATEIYAEADFDKARAIMKRIG